MRELLTSMQNNPRATSLYAAFFLGCIAVWKFLQFRNAALDHVLTLSASLQSLAFALLVIQAGGGCGEGISEKTLWAFFIAHVARLSTTLWGPGYTPEDNTSDVYLYQILELVGVLLLGFYVLKLGSMRSMRDVGQGFERWSVLSGMVGASLVFAYFSKSTGHNDWFADLSWMFSVWLEAFALGPQVMLLNVSHQVEDGAMHFVALSTAESLAFGYFWCRSAWEQYAEFKKDGSHVFYWGVLSCAVIRFVLCAAFIYLFVRKRGGDGKGRYSGVEDVFADDMI
jgi:hypothetical protein